MHWCMHACISQWSAKQGYCFIGSKVNVIHVGLSWLNVTKYFSFSVVVHVGIGFLIIYNITDWSHSREHTCTSMDCWSNFPIGWLASQNIPEFVLEGGRLTLTPWTRVNLLQCYSCKKKRKYRGPHLIGLDPSVEIVSCAFLASWRKGYCFLNTLNELWKWNKK